MGPFLEHGALSVLYAPRVEHPVVLGLGDVQRVFLVLHPEGSRNARLIVVPRKQLPRAGPARQRFWLVVDRIAPPDLLLGDLAGGEYETKTLGLRHQPPARLAAAGTYALANHGAHTHLRYALALPEELGPVHQELRLGRRGSFIAAVVNPEQRWLGSTRRRAWYPPAVQARFRDRRFAPADPKLLDARHADLVLIPSRSDPVADLTPSPVDGGRLLGALGLPVTPTLLRPALDGQWR